jgi:hypothetical protein
VALNLAAALGGGNFANGAVTAAFGYMFNQMSRAQELMNERIKSGAACPPSHAHVCAGLKAGTPEEAAKAAALAENVANVADATDLAAQVVGVGCVATANPCAIPAAATSESAKVVSIVLAPPGPSEMALGAGGDLLQAAMQDVIRISPVAFFFGTAAVFISTEAAKPAVKASDLAPVR